MSEIQDTNHANNDQPLNVPEDPGKFAEKLPQGDPKQPTSFTSPSGIIYDPLSGLGGAVAKEIATLVVPESPPEFQINPFLPMPLEGGVVQYLVEKPRLKAIYSIKSDLDPSGFEAMSDSLSARLKLHLLTIWGGRDNAPALLIQDLPARIARIIDLVSHVPELCPALAKALQEARSSHREVSFQAFHKKLAAMIPGLALIYRSSFIVKIFNWKRFLGEAEKKLIPDTVSTMLSALLQSTFNEEDCRQIRELHADFKADDDSLARRVNSLKKMEQEVRVDASFESVVEALCGKDPVAVYYQNLADRDPEASQIKKQLGTAEPWIQQKVAEYRQKRPRFYQRTLAALPSQSDASAVVADHDTKDESCLELSEELKKEFDEKLELECNKPLREALGTEDLILSQMFAKFIAHIHSRGCFADLSRGSYSVKDLAEIIVVTCGSLAEVMIKWLRDYGKETPGNLDDEKAFEIKSGWLMKKFFAFCGSQGASPEFIEKAFEQFRQSFLTTEFNVVITMNDIMTIIKSVATIDDSQDTARKAIVSPDLKPQLVSGPVSNDPQADTPTEDPEAMSLEKLRENFDQRLARLTLENPKYLPHFNALCKAYLIEDFRSSHAPMQTKRKQLAFSTFCKIVRETPNITSEVILDIFSRFLAETKRSKLGGYQFDEDPIDAVMLNVSIVLEHIEKTRDTCRRLESAIKERAKPALTEEESRYDRVASEVINSGISEDNFHHFGIDIDSQESREAVQAMWKWETELYMRFVGNFGFRNEADVRELYRIRSSEPDKEKGSDDLKKIPDLVISKINKKLLEWSESSIPTTATEEETVPPLPSPRALTPEPPELPKELQENERAYVRSYLGKYLERICGNGVGSNNSKLIFIRMLWIFFWKLPVAISSPV